MRAHAHTQAIAQLSAASAPLQPSYSVSKSVSSPPFETSGSTSVQPASSSSFSLLPPPLPPPLHLLLFSSSFLFFLLNFLLLLHLSPPLPAFLLPLPTFLLLVFLLFPQLPLPSPPSSTSTASTSTLLFLLLYLLLLPPSLPYLSLLPARFFHLLLCSSFSSPAGRPLLSHLPPLTTASFSSSAFSLSFLYSLLPALFLLFRFPLFFLHLILIVVIFLLLLQLLSPPPPPPPSPPPPPQAGPLR